MKKHILYQRNHKGQYVCGITTRNLTLAVAFAIFLAGGFIHSVNAGRSAIDAVGVGVPVRTGENATTTVERACKTNQRGICDLTDEATKIRIYELTEKGTKQIKWYGKTKISPVTAYTSRVQETDASPCISADGSDICKRYANGEKICASNDYKLGSVIEVQGLGKCVVADRMNKRYTGTGRVDWYMGMDLVSARKWGLRHVAISSF